MNVQCTHYAMYSHEEHHVIQVGDRQIQECTNSVIYTHIKDKC